MGIGRTLADKKGKEVCKLPKETNSNSKSRKNRRRQRKMLPVQRLFETCKRVFANSGPWIIPPLQDIEKLRSVLDGIRPEDVGLNHGMPYFRTNPAQRNPIITYLHIYECEKFSMGIFCLPPSAVIPLHNHPGMTVFSKLLFGTMHIKSYDWVVDSPSDIPTIFKPSETQTAQIPEMRLAEVKVDADFTAPCKPSILYPSEGGNMHCFRAVTACAVLDVLGPPYSDPDGRHCAYYLNFPFSNFSVDGVCIPEEESLAYGWLQETERPEDFEVEVEMFNGPNNVES